MPKIEITPLAAESLGTRSMATFIKTADTAIVLDPGCSLGQRMRLDPHPKEYEALHRANQKLIEACKKAEILIISHYHYDHLKPVFTDYHFILSNQELADLIYTDKIILAKDNRENINFSQRRRGYLFQKSVQKKVKQLVHADAQRFEFGNTTIRLSKPFPHGEPNSKQGFVLLCEVQYEDEIFVFGEVQGPIASETITFILSLNPTYVYVGGPPLYLSGFRVPETTLDLARSNMIQLIKNVPTLIFDHHLLRAANWREWASPIYQEAELSNHWIGTAADFSKEPVVILEAIRKELYLKYPPPENFMKWTKQSETFKQTTLPPILQSPF